MWPDEDQSVLKWYEMPLAEDGSYQFNVSIGDFGYRRGNYNIHVYAVGTEGNAYLVGGIRQIIG